MDAASLALGIIGSFQVCVEGYRIITSMKHASPDAARIQCKCEIEEARFLLWGKNWGLVDESGALVVAARVHSKLVEEPIAMSRLVAKILSEIQTILGSTGVLKAKYGAADAALTESPSGGANDSSHQTGSMSMKRRITWSIRDKDSFQTLVGEIRELNDGLYSLLPTQSQSLLAEALNTEMLLTKRTSRDLEIIKDVSDRENPELQFAAELRSLGIEADSVDSSWNALPSTKVSKMCFTFNSPNYVSGPSRDFPTRTISHALYTPAGSSNEIPVMIEWRPYDPHAVGSKAFVLALRADGLCRLLRKFSATSLSVLPCLGFFDDVAVGRFGITFQLPQIPLFGEKQPLTLNDIIQSQPKLPPLEDRFKLAATLSRTLFAFHCSDWLHKDLSSHNILFGSNAEDYSVADLTRPYIIGFTYSRPEDHEGISSEIQVVGSKAPPLYQHPHLMTSAGPDAPRYSRSFDLWALGCVLLEIGLWRRLGDFWKTKYAEDPMKWAERVQNSLSNELHGRCGGVYKEVVDRCLTSSEKVTMSPNVTGTQLFWEVVVKLESLQV